jgi:hypothetical protein
MYLPTSSYDKIKIYKLYILAYKFDSQALSRLKFYNWFKLV